MNKAIRRCLQKLFGSKEAAGFGIVICMLLIFKEPLIAFSSKHWVQPIMSKIQPSIYRDIAFFIICLGIIGYFSLKQWKHYLPAKKIACYSLLCSIIYSLFRFQLHSDWDFTTLKCVGWLKYMDIFLLTGSISVLLLVKLTLFHFRKKSLANSILFNDAPLESKKGKKIISAQDDYGYYTYAQNIANGINNSQFETAFAIGIISKWGGGKTSFFNMIKDGLNDGLIEIDFNPWRSANPKAIIKDFFETVRHSLAPHSSQLEHQLLQYGEKIIDLNDSIFSKSAKFLFAGFVPANALSKLFDQINNTLKLLDRKVVIFIDDVDRLDKDEVFEVIRLIRNTANFYNTFFVVAYDRAYLLHSLKCLEVHQYETFLEKIFQLEITLPYFDKAVLVNRLMTNLGSILPKERLEQISTIIFTNNILKRTLLKWLETLRDVTILSNSILLNITKKADDIDLIDFIRIELLRIKFPSVYKAFFEHYEFFLETMEPSSQLFKSGTFKLKYNTSQHEYFLKAYLKHNRDKLSIPGYSIDDISDFFENIFPGKDPNLAFYHRAEKPRLSIVNVEQFLLYYCFEIPGGYLPESLVLKAIKYSAPETKQQFKTWVDEKKEDKLLEIIYKLKEKDFSDRLQFENLIHSIFYLANLESTVFKNSIDTQRVNFDFKELYEMIRPEGKFIQKFYSPNDDSYSNFIHSIFNNDESQRFYEAYFLKEAWVFTHSHFQKSLTSIMEQGDIADYLIGYLRSCCQKETKLTSNIWYFYDCCKIPSLVPRGNVHEIHRDNHIPEADTIFIDFISTKDLNTFLLYNIYFRPSDTTRFQVGNMGNEVFGSQTKFEEFLYAQNETNWTYLHEYKEFYEIAKSIGPEMIDFKFKVIDIEKRIR